MDSTAKDYDAQALYSEVKAIWEENAAFWDEAIGDGNDFQRVLIGPAAERLLALRPGELVLDIACGNGVFARRMAQLGAQVVACDFSPHMIERARERSSEFATKIEYLLVDATDYDQVLALALGASGLRRFDAAYCGMAIQDMAEIEPMFAAVARLLKPGGRFVFSIPHPSFNNAYIRKALEETDREGELVVETAIKITGYIQPRIDKGLGIIGQPAPHYYFHRPLSLLLNTAFRYGYTLDGFEEPVLDPEGEPRRAFSWEHFTGIPPALVARLRAPLSQPGSPSSGRASRRR